LRAAHAYMLISMPTDTSTIFGVFQAILALSLLNRTNFALGAKLMRNKNFASEIFRLSCVYSYAALQNLFTFLCGGRQSTVGSMASMLLCVERHAG
jgi:hypothetical protein